MGTIISLILLPAAIFILARSFILELMKRSSSDAPLSIVLEPVVSDTSNFELCSSIDAPQGNCSHY